MPTNWSLIIVAGLIIIGLVIPTQRVLSVYVSIQDYGKVDVQFLEEKLPFIPYLINTFSTDSTLGNTLVRIQIKNSINTTTFDKAFFITSPGSNTVKTNSLIDSGYFVTVYIPNYNFERSIRVG